MQGDAGAHVYVLDCPDATGASREKHRNTRKRRGARESRSYVRWMRGYSVQQVRKAHEKTTNWVCTLARRVLAPFLSLSLEFVFLEKAAE